MSDSERQRRLHVENRLQELRRKHGDDLEHAPLPAWLDTYEGALQCKPAADQPNHHAPVGVSPGASGRAVSGGAQTAVGGGLVVQKADFTDLDV